MSHAEFYGLLATYLSNEPGSAEVLSDYLEERGGPRIAFQEDLDDRLDLVLCRLAGPLAEHLACDFAEHVLPLYAALRSDYRPHRLVELKRAALAGETEPVELIREWQAWEESLSQIVWFEYNVADEVLRDVAWAAIWCAHEEAAAAVAACARNAAGILWRKELAWQSDHAAAALRFSAPLA